MLSMQLPAGPTGGCESQAVGVGWWRLASLPGNSEEARGLLRRTCLLGSCAPTADLRVLLIRLGIGCCCTGYLGRYPADLHPRSNQPDRIRQQYV